MKTNPSARYALLGSMMSGPKHGYEIRRFLDSAFGSTWYVGTSQLYALLRRLEEKGLLRSSLHAQDTRPPRRVFSLTSEGRGEFLEWVRRPTAHVRDLRIEFLAKLFFFDRLSLQGAGELIETQFRILEQVKKTMKRRQEEESDPYKKLVFGFKIATVEAWLDWLVTRAKPFVRSAVP
jgi:PadR family transcriptional regulator AphA